MTERRRPVISGHLVVGRALRSLRNLRLLCQVAGRHTADRIVRGIGEACRLLEEHPFAGRARNEVRPGLRSIATSPHVVFYRVSNDVAEIVRVLDGRRDLEEIFVGDG